MNILFLIYHGLSAVSGISKKILYQMEGLRSLGHDVRFCHYEIDDKGHRIRMIDNTILEDYGNNRLAPVKKRICYGAICDYASDHHTDLVYIRSFHNANPFTIGLVKKLKKNGAKVVLEIPTYPYDQEYHHQPLWWKAELFMDKCFRHQLAQASDAIVTFSDKTEIFGQKTIRISNGIDLESIPVKTVLSPPLREIHLLAVAEIHYWHAYDRIIKGLGEYYLTSPQRPVFLHLIGGIGPIEQRLFDSLMEEYHLEGKVILYGQKQGRELDELFARCDFAIGSLGRHRSGIDKIKTLKNREYAARGIPFIYSETDDDFEHMPYIMKAPADDTAIDIKAILDFRDSIQLTPQDIRNTISHLTWQEQMQKVMNNLFEKK